MCCSFDDTIFQTSNLCDPDAYLGSVASQLFPLSNTNSLMPQTWIFSGNTSSTSESLQDRANTADNTRNSLELSDFLPPLHIVFELVEIFFEKYYLFLPIIHKPTIVRYLKLNGLNGITF